MPRIIAKFGYMKPNDQSKSSYVKYIAKRDGVIKNVTKNFNKPSTSKQEELIKHLLKSDPKLRSNDLYQNHLKYKTLGSATEFITDVEETNYQKLAQSEKYVEYIAKRPNVVKEETHGLFSLADSLNLNDVLKEVENHDGYIWTAIISIKREDAHRLGYESLDRWKNLVRSKQIEMATNLKIDSHNFKWYGAFHNESYHPHIHLVMCSKDAKQGYLSKTGIDRIRSSFAKEIFKNDLMNIYKKQTLYRDQLKLASEYFITSTINDINNNLKPIKSIDQKLIELSKKLKELPGKHAYGYLPRNLKAIVDEIVNEVSLDPNIQKLFDLWYKQRQEVLFTYTDKKEQIRSLSELNEFKPIKNVVIKVAKDINLLALKDEIALEPVLKTEAETKEESLDYTSIELKEVYLKEADFKLEEIPIDETTKVAFPSLKLLHHISNLFETSMISNAKKYHQDKEKYRIVKKQKVALGQNIKDTTNN